MLILENVKANYGHVAAVRGVSMTVEEGEVVCIAGPNGAGKSTLMHCIAGAKKPAGGTIIFAGRSVVGESTEITVRRGISLVPEGRRIFGGLSVEENLKLATHYRENRSEIKNDLDRVLDMFPILRERYKSGAGNLSGGEQQMLAISRALLTRPRIMLVDEPALGLAPQIVDQVYDTLLDLRDEGMTLLIVEQSVERALENADRLYVMRSGLVELSGTTDALWGDDRVGQAYFGFDTQNPGTSA